MDGEYALQYMQNLNMAYLALNMPKKSTNKKSKLPENKTQELDKWLQDTLLSAIPRC
jgi:hypothetical protein